jgi:hypothetical protein
MDEGTGLVVMDEAVDIHVVEDALRGSAEERRERLTLRGEIQLPKHGIAVIAALEGMKLSAISHLRPEIMLAVFKARKEVLEFADLGDGNDNIILAHHCKSKMSAEELSRSMERRKVLTPPRDERPGSLTIEIHKKRSVSVSPRARNHTLSPGLQNLSLGHRAI